MSKVLIDDKYLHDIADSIRKMTGKKDLITTDSMAREIEEAEIIWDPEEKWQRPLDWPDYSAIDITNFEGMYFTYDTTHADHYDEWVGLYCVCNGGYKVERGQIVNGVFVAEATFTKSSGTIFEEWIESTITGHIVYKISAATSGQPITSIGLRDMSATLRTDGRVNRVYSFQPIQERYGRLPNLTSFSNWGNYYVESDTILDLKKLTSLYQVWSSSYNIENINISGFDSQVTSIQQAFSACRRLRYINETDKLVTSKCTSMYYTFNECYNLRFLDCRGWDTSNVTRMDNLFTSCLNLYKADVSLWNVSKVTIMTNIFNGCYSLKTIDVSRWVVTLPTSFGAIFNACASVESLDLSGFDSTNVTSFSSMFSGCVSLKELDVSHFNTSKVTTMYYMFYNCRRLQHLDVSNFDTSKVTDFRYMFEYTPNLDELDISNFSFASATMINSFLYGSSARIKRLSLIDNLTSQRMSSSYIDYAFGSLPSLQEIDLTGFDFSGITAPNYVFRYNYSLEKAILPDSLHYIGQYFFDSCRNLETIILPSTTLVTLTNTNAFSGANRAKTIYVPDNLVASYQTANNWKNLSNVTFAALSTYEE